MYHNLLIKIKLKSWVCVLAFHPALHSHITTVRDCLPSKKVSLRCFKADCSLHFLFQRVTTRHFVHKWATDTLILSLCSKMLLLWHGQHGNACPGAAAASCMSVRGHYCNAVPGRECFVVFLKAQEAGGLERQRHKRPAPTERDAAVCE